MRRWIRFGFVAVVLSIASSAMGATKVKWQDDADKRRADYVYLEAQRQLALENNDAYFELLKRAWELNNDDAIVGHDLGFYMLMIGQTDREMAIEGLTLLDSYFRKHPDDFYGSVLYGTLCERLGKADIALEVWQKLHEIYPQKTEVSMRLVDGYMSKRTDAQAQNRALNLLADIQKVEGPSLQISARKVMSYLSKRDTAAVVNELAELIKATPRSPESRVYAGDVYMSLDKNKEALDYYNQACEVDPSSGLAYYKRAGYYREVGDSAMYDREVFRALELPDLELDTKLEIFKGYVREQYADTLQQPRINQLFGKLVDMYPHDTSVHDLYSSYFVAINDYKSAAEQQEYVIDSDMSNADRWRALISLYFSAREYDKALDACQRAIKLFDKNQAFYLLAGEASAISDRLDEGLNYLEKCIMLDSLNNEMVSQALTTQGDILFKKNNIEAAIEKYNEAIEKNPENSLAMNNCAYFMACSDMDLDKAAELSRRSLTIDPDNGSSLDTYAWIMFKKGDYKEAKVFIDKVLQTELEPTAELLQHAGDIYYMCGEPDQALEFWEGAARLDPDDVLLQKKIKNKAFYYK